MRGFGRTLSVLVAMALLAAPMAARSTGTLVPRVVDVGGAVTQAALASIPEGAWYALDGHVHTDHSHDAGFPHQQDKKPENHDTFVADQIQQAELWGEDVVTLTDHRTYDQAYDPDYKTGGALLLDGEEWGGYPHSTAWGLTEVLEQGPDEGVCGVARAAREVRAQDAIFGVAHPEDGRRSCISVESLADTPIAHLEAFRIPHFSFWLANIAADRRLAPVTGSDNHFKQLYGTDGGTGHSSTMVFAEARTKGGITDGVHAGRVQSIYRKLGPRLTSLADGDGDGTYEAMTGGWVDPAGPTVRMAYRAELAVGLWLQVLDRTGAVVAQEPVKLPDETLAFDLPAGEPLYFAQLAIEPVERVSGYIVHEYLAYEDSVRVLSAPVYLSAPTPVENGTQATAAGATPLSEAIWAGFSDVALSDGIYHATWQQRTTPYNDAMYSRSTDGGATWSEPVVVSTGSDAMTPSIAADGARVLVAWEDHNPTRHGGQIRAALSTDGGATWGSGQLVSDPQYPGARPDVATDGGTDHIAWMSMEDGYKIRYHKRLPDQVYFGQCVAAPCVSFPPVRLSNAFAWEGGTLNWVVPPRTIRHVPATVNPTIVVSGASVAVAWEDNREDPTPLRNGTPDDWGIYGAFSSDTGKTWSADVRWTPRNDARAFNPAEPEEMEGNTARAPSLAVGPDGTLILAYADSYPTRVANTYAQRSTDGGATWQPRTAVSAVSNEFAARPAVAWDTDRFVVAWQDSDGSRWSLKTAMSPDGSAFTAPSTLTTGTGYAGFPALAGEVALWTGESGGAYGIWAGTQ